MTDDEIYRLRGGSKEYEDYYNALTVARAKADTEDEAVEVCRREGNDLQPVVRVTPDGDEIELED